MRNSNPTSYFTSKNEDFLLHQTSKNEDFIHKHDDFSGTMCIWWECWSSNRLPWKIGTWKHQVTHLRMALEKMIKWMDQQLFQYHNFWGWTYLVGGFKHFLFSIIYGTRLPIDSYFSRWLLHHQPDTLATYFVLTRGTRFDPWPMGHIVLIYCTRNMWCSNHICLLYRIRWYCCRSIVRQTWLIMCWNHRMLKYLKWKTMCGGFI